MVSNELRTLSSENLRCSKQLFYPEEETTRSQRTWYHTTSIRECDFFKQKNSEDNTWTHFVEQKGSHIVGNWFLFKDSSTQCVRTCNTKMQYKYAPLYVLQKMCDYIHQNLMYHAQAVYSTFGVSDQIDGDFELQNSDLGGLARLFNLAPNPWLPRAASILMADLQSEQNCGSCNYEVLWTWSDICVSSYRSVWFPVKHHKP